MQELPGTWVYARAQRRTILDVADHGTCRSVRLAAPGERGDPLTLITPFDRLQPVAASEVPRWRGRRCALAACAATLAQCHAAGELHPETAAGIDVLFYQLEPALAVARGLATRVLLADEVGLGKTIQAGLILSSLRRQGALTRALILTPAGLRDQWTRELRDRFGLDTTVMDAAGLAALGASLPPWLNPWTLPGITLASIDLLKRGELLPQIETVTWDAVVVDEAHHAARGTDRHAAAALACSRARVVVLITATPHNGDASAFAHLCDLGSLDGHPVPIRVFRRTRADVSLGSQARRVRLIGVHPSAVERTLHRRLEAYTTRVWRETGADAPARLAMIVLRKRALSGPAPLARSLARRLASLETPGPAGAPTQLALEFRETLGGELIADDGEPVDLLGVPGLRDAAGEKAMVAALLEETRAAIPFDSKAAALTRAVMRAREPAIVFTEYRDTLEDLRRRLEGHVTLATLHGGMLPAERLRSVSAFGSGAVRLLLATDAAAEGLNLHQRCRWVVHHEAPWSPARLEQRNGRVDRLGQHQRVHVWHLMMKSTEEERILSGLAARSAHAARALAEATVAQSVFEGTRPPAAGHGAHTTRRRSGDGEREADRLAVLRRLRRPATGFCRPVAAAVRRRGAFATLRRGEALGIFQADVLDGCGRRVAVLAAGFHGRLLADVRGAARKYFGRAARRSISVHRRVARCRAAREHAIGREIARIPVVPFQAALFDRAGAIENDARRAEIARAAEEQRERQDQLERSCVGGGVGIRLVALFVAR